MNRLTLEIAKTLIGKTIVTHYYGYNGQDGDDRFTVGEIISQFELAERNKNFGRHPNQAAYWEDYMSPAELSATKNTLELLTIEGRTTYIRCDINNSFFPEPTFHCSDADRVVTYKLAD